MSTLADTILATQATVNANNALLTQIEGQVAGLVTSVGALNGGASDAAALGTLQTTANNILAQLTPTPPAAPQPGA